MSRPAISALVVGALVLASCGGDTKTVTETVGRGQAAQGGSKPSASAPTGSLGDTLNLFDDYEQDATPVTDDLAITLLSVKDPATPDQPDVAQFTQKRGYHWVRLQFRVQQKANTESGSITPANVLARDSEGQQFEAESSQFDPDLFAGGGRLLPGDTRTGYATIQVPDGSDIREIRWQDAGFTQPNMAVWRLSQ